MVNRHSYTLNLDTELGDAILNVIAKTGFGESTYIIKEFLDKHKEELIEFWTKQGKDGSAIWDKWYQKYSLTKVMQADLKKQAEFERRKKTYLALGLSEKKATELASIPKEELEQAIQVTKSMSYIEQTKLGQNKQTDKELDNLLEKRSDLQEQLNNINQIIEVHRKYAQHDKIPEQEAKRDVLTNQLQELDTQIEKLKASEGDQHD